jgi:hypothetical protein
VTAAVLGVFGVEAPRDMIGKNILE